MPTSNDVRPLTAEQTVQLRRDLALVEERLQDIAILMRISYGDDSQAVIRADETSGALQRLKWEFERTQVRALAAGAALMRGLLHRDPDC
jgi:Trm5-related predicted tRNA methylase